MIRIKPQRVAIICLVVFIFGYLGPFSRYRMIPTYLMTIGLCTYYCTMRIRFRLDVNFIMGMILLLYVILSTVFLSGSRGINYCLILLNGILVMNMPIIREEWKSFINICEKVAICFAIYTFINAIDHNLTARLFGWMLTESQITLIQRNIAGGGIPGLAGEVSYNAFSIAIGTVCVLSKISTHKIIERKDLVKVIVLYAGLVLTDKRTMILISMFLVAIMLISYITSRKWSLSKAIFVFILFIVGSMTVSYIYNSVYNMLFEGGAQRIALSGREWFWRIAIDLFRSKPIFGNGINTYDIYYNIHSVGKYLGFAGAHNSYLQYLAEIGIVGFFIAIVFMFRNLIRTISYVRMHNDRISWFSLYLQIVVLLYAFMGNPFYQPQEFCSYFIVLSMLKFYNKQKTVNEVNYGNVVGII